MNKKIFFGTILSFFLLTNLQAQNYPSYNTNPLPPDKTGMEHNAVELVKKMGLGWNLGNSFEAILWVPDENNPGKYRPTSAVERPDMSFESAWGNPEVTHLVSDGVYKQGFNVYRIPCAWDLYVVDTANAKIQDFWFARVKQTIDSCMKHPDMYVLLNIHYDGGWLETNCNPDKQEINNKKQKAYWEQIATYFRDYDERLLFAACNEPNVHNETQMKVLASYEQTFVDAVRATGGRNYYRTLIIQGPSTDIDETMRLMRVQKDDAVPMKTAERLAMWKDSLNLTPAQLEQLWAIEKKYNPEFDVEERDEIFDAKRAREQTRIVKIKEVLTDQQNVKLQELEVSNQLTLPVDVIPDRLMMEVHYYSPWTFAGMTEDADWGKECFYWGERNMNPKDPERSPNSTYGDLNYLKDHFNMMKVSFVDKGIPVILGEYGCNRKEFNDTLVQRLHHQSRMDWLYEVTKNALEYGLVPVYWDNGYIGTPSMGLFNRLNGKPCDPEAVEIIKQAAKDADKYWKE